MKKENLQKAKELASTQYKLKILKDMVSNHWFSIEKKIRFEDEWSKINLREFDEKTSSELKTIISDYCDKRIADIDKEIEEL